jgi:serine/threonine-protein kinase
MTADEQVRAQLAMILSHDLFAGAERRTRLLRFLVEQSLAGQTGALKESVIAMEVFDRPADHDPKIDSLVRVEMGRLRSRLIEYYGQAGKDDPVRIEIPKGNYTPVFTHLKPPAPDPTVEPMAIPARHVPANPWSQRRIWAMVAAVCTVAVSLWFVTRPAQAPPQPSVAVLPFLNLTGDPANEFLSDGITDELTSVLAEARSLRVVARTSAFQFKGKSADVREIGRSLNAGAVVEGSVARQKDKWHIVAQLIRVSDGYHLWAQSYDSLPEELQNTEGEVARATVRTLAADQPGLIGGSLLMSTKNPEAHDLALRARSAFLRGTFNSTMLSAQLAQQAIDKDPSYPVPYLLLASADYTLGQFTVLSPKEALERSLAATEQALKLNPGFADAHAAHAMYTYFYYWDWPKAEEEFKLALSLGSLQVPNLYGWGLATRGRFQEAQRQFSRAEELDPVAAAPRINRGWLWGFQGDLTKARAENRRVLEMNPEDIYGLIGLASLDLAEKNCPAAAADSARLDKIGANLPFSQITRADVWALCGKPEEARKLRDELDRSQPRGISFYGMAVLDGILHDYDRGFIHLAKAADGREIPILSIKADPGFKPFAKDPRYIALLHRLHLL